MRFKKGLFKSGTTICVSAESRNRYRNRTEARTNRARLSMALEMESSCRSMSRRSTNPD